MSWNEPTTEGTKRCPRCGTDFSCKVDDLKNCDCVAIKVALPVLKRLKNTYSDCLCPNCLQTLAESGDTSAT